MRRLLSALVGFAMAGSIVMTGPAAAVNVGEEGCTPGYWKTHTDNWFEEPGVPIPTSLTLSGAGFVTNEVSGDATLLEALSFRGGSSTQEAEQILLRAAAAAWLNAAHEGLGYPYRRGGADGLLAMVNEAIASGDRATMLALAEHLDATNNLGCPL